MIAVFDLDGTLSCDAGRIGLLEQARPDWEKYYALMPEDPPLPVAVDLMRLYLARRDHVEVWTCRPDVYRPVTVQWLARHISPVFGTPASPPVRMRAAGDTREAELVKADWLPLLPGKPDLMLEDRLKTVEYFRGLGITTYQVQFRDY